MLDVSVRLSCRWWWCYYWLLLLLDMSSWPRWESRWYSRCSWALTGRRGSIGNDTALSYTDYDRTAERRLTPPLASHQQRCHITPEFQSDKSSATDVQVRRSLRSWCWRATDCSIRFVLSSSFYLAILPRYTVVVALVVVCSVLSCPVLSCSSCSVPFYPLYTSKSYPLNQVVFRLATTCHRFSKPFTVPSLLHGSLEHGVLCRDDEGHTRQLIAGYCRYYRLRIRSVHRNPQKHCDPNEHTAPN